MRIPFVIFLSSFITQAYATFIPGTCWPRNEPRNMTIHINNIPDTFPLVLHLPNIDIELIQDDNLTNFTSADGAYRFTIKSLSTSFCDGGVLSTSQGEAIDFTCQIAIGCHH